MPALAVAAAVLTLASPLTVIGTPADLAIGTFHRNLYGTSVFVAAGSSVNVYGTYAGLKRNSAYFTVMYGNKICAPAQAFPVGPFITDANGFATLAANVTLPAAVDVGAPGSVSVRRGDDATDQDGDGKTGPSDVVAVPGKPGIGLVECDSNPRVLNF